MGPFQDIQRSRIGTGNDRVQRWIEVWDYSGDAIYRGFVADANGERALFVFFEDSALGHGLKSGLVSFFRACWISALLSLWLCHTGLLVRSADMFLPSSLIALFELASMDAFGCSQIVACVKRSRRTNEMELVRSLGWCGFNLTTLEPWKMDNGSGPSLSTEWLFLVAEV